MLCLALWVCLFAGPLCPVHQVREQILWFTLQRRNQTQKHSRDLLQLSCRLFPVISFLSVFESMCVSCGCAHSAREKRVYTCANAYSYSVCESFNLMTCCLHWQVQSLTWKIKAVTISVPASSQCFAFLSQLWFGRPLSGVSGNYLRNMVFSFIASLLPFQSPQPCSWSLVLSTTFWAWSHRQAENIFTILT